MAQRFYLGISEPRPARIRNLYPDGCNIHTGMVAATNCNTPWKRLSGPIPTNLKPPEHIGEHIKQKRHKDGLLQSQLAKNFQISEATLANWEKGTNKPSDKFYPKIISFIGYLPPREPTNIAEVIWRYRMENGMSRMAFCKLLNIDERTLKGFEQNSPTQYPSIWKTLIETIPQIKAFT